MRRSAAVVWSVLVAACGLAAAQGTAIDPRLDPEDDAFLNRQAEALLAEAEKTFESVPPQWPEPRERRLALLLIDGVAHESYAPARPPVQAFFHRRMDLALEDIERRQVDRGAVIWKLYNHGFVVRTPSVTLAFDVNPGTRGFRTVDPVKGKMTVETPGFPMPTEWVERLARQCDVLFVSHRHADHAVESVMQACLDAGKPAIAPPDVFEDRPIHERITHLERIAHETQSLPVRGGEVELKVVVYPGQQYQGSGIPNNVVLVYTPEGMTFAHNGDQINDPYPAYQKDFEWIDRVKDHHTVDVLLTNNWTNDVLRMVRGFNPKLVIPGHEIELGHPLWDRVPYWGDEDFLKLNFTEMKAEYPVVVMTWGESYRYMPE